MSDNKKSSNTLRTAVIVGVGAVAVGAAAYYFLKSSGEEEHVEVESASLVRITSCGTSATLPAAS